MPEDFGPEPHIAVDRVCVRVEQQLRGVVPQTPAGIERAVDAETVGLPRPHLGHEAVPHVAVAVGQHQLCLGAVSVEQAQRHLITAGGHREVRAPAIRCGAERVWLPGDDFQRHLISVRDTSRWMTSDTVGYARWRRRITSATSPVHPVWWHAPKPAPLSP